MKKLPLVTVLLMLVLSFTACNWFARPEPTEPPPTGTGAPETTTAVTEPQTQAQPVVLYLPNDNADGFVVKAALTDGTAADLVALLVAEGALPEGCALLSFEGGTADMNAAYGAAISSTGTTGEYLRMGCVVNTLLTFYGLESIYITVEGRVPETGHNEYDFPLCFYENQQAA